MYIHTHAYIPTHTHHTHTQYVFPNLYYEIAHTGGINCVHYHTDPLLESR